MPAMISKLAAALAAFLPLPEHVAAFALGLTVGLLVARKLDARAATKTANALAKAARKVTPNRVPRKR